MPSKPAARQPDLRSDQQIMSSSEIERTVIANPKGSRVARGPAIVRATIETIVGCSIAEAIGLWRLSAAAASK